MLADLVVPALGPVMLVIALGFGARASGLVAEAHVGGIERVTYVILFPTLLFSTLSQARFDGPDVWTLGLVMAGTQLLVSLAAWPLFVRSGLPGPAATSAFQGAIRFNTYIALGLVLALHGTAGVEAAAVPLALVIIIVNLFCVAMLARHGERPPGAPAPSVLRGILTNPLILASVAGLAVNPLHVDWPGPVDTVFGWFSTAAIGLGLFAVGAGLRPVTGRGSLAAIAGAGAVSLVAKPALFVGLGLLAGLPATLLSVGLLCMAAPTASSGYILARQMGGDAPLMAQIVTVGTLASAATVAAWLVLLPPPV